jgi:hypothetical protein
MENGISKQQLAQFEVILENWQTQLRTVTGSTVKERCTILDNCAPDRADRAIDANLKELLFRQAHECHRLLLYSAAAFKRRGGGRKGKNLRVLKTRSDAKNLSRDEWFGRYCPILRQCKRKERIIPRSLTRFMEFSGISRRTFPC